MKIVFFIRDITDCGGIQKTTCNLINSLKARHKCSISVVSLYHKNEDTFFDIDNRVKLISLFDRKINLHTDGMAISRQIAKMFKHIEFDYLIIQGTEYSNYIPSYIWKKKVIVCEHGYFGFGHIFGLHWRGVRKALKRATAVVTLTSLDEEQFKKYSYNRIIIRHIYNAYEPIKKDKTSQYDLESKTIVSCGSLVKLKGFDRAILVAQKIFNIHPDWKWEIYGEGPLHKELEEKIFECHLENNVILKGYEKEKDNIFGQKSMEVLTSDFEGFGMVLVEAMQYGLPIVCFDIKYGPREIVEHNKSGKLVHAYDCDNMAKVINHLIENPDQRKKYSDYSRYSLERFSPDTVVKQWLELFNEISKDHPIV